MVVSTSHCIAALALAIFLPDTAFSQTLLSEGFETDPLLAGWTRSGLGAGWK